MVRNPIRSAGDYTGKYPRSLRSALRSCGAIVRKLLAIAQRFSPPWTTSTRPRALRCGERPRRVTSRADEAQLVHLSRSPRFAVSLGAAAESNRIEQRCAVSAAAHFSRVPRPVPARL